MGLGDWATLPAGCWLHPITNALKRNEVMKTALKRQRAERCSVDNILMQLGTFRASYPSQEFVTPARLIGSACQHASDDRILKVRQKS
jgi:hypothetical protein